MNYKNQNIESAYKVLDGGSLDRDEALALIRTEMPFLMDLYSLADKVRHAYSASYFETCEISNAKSGNCSEDCSFCAQSSRHKTKAPVYSLKGAGELLKAANLAKEHGTKKFCIVVSGKGYKKPNDEFKRILESIKTIREKTGLEIHCSPGILSGETADMLKEAGAAVVNHNIETAPSFFPKICTSHKIEDRFETVRVVKKAGMKICCGGIFGLGESAEQRVEFAFTLKDLDVDSIPINIHQKIDGTKNPESEISITEILNTIAVFRLVNPAKAIKIAAGRNTILSDYQGLVFHAGANGMIVGGYLTIPGRDIEKDKVLINSL